MVISAGRIFIFYYEKYSKYFGFQPENTIRDKIQPFKIFFLDVLLTDNVESNVK